MSHSAVGGRFLHVLIGAAKTRGQAKNNADASDYRGKQNHQKDSIFPTYLGTYNIYHMSMQSCLHLSPPLRQS